MNTELIGEWVLVAYRQDEEEAELGDEGPNYKVISEWVKSTSLEFVSEVQSISGLVLTINDNHDFSEVNINNPKIEWFNNEGILDDEVTPFDGHLVSYNNTTSILSNSTPSWAVPVKDNYTAKCRFDDGDTLICETLCVKDNKLVRTMNVVIDEEHLSRITLLYEKSF